MEIPGFAGKILYIDLTTGKTREEPLDPELVRTFIGGFGIQQKLAYDLIPPDVDPLSPESTIIFGTGVFSGTMFPGSSELMASFKQPLNGAIGTACGGGQFPIMLKTAGYDFVVISGKAKEPIYLKIGEEVEIGDASGLWGKDVFETVDALRSQYEPCSVIAIGPAGENLVKASVATIDQGGGSIGACGLPAVMGSKNLKAVVAQMGSKGIRIADRLKLQKTVDDMINRVIGYHRRVDMMNGGAMAMTGAWLGEETGGGFTKSWREVAPLPPDVMANGQAVFQSILGIHNRMRSKISCPTCHMCDKDRIDVREGPHAGMVTYFTAVMARGFKGGTIDDYTRELIYLDTLNRLGICRHNFFGIMQLVNYLYQEGIITKEDTGGIELKGDMETSMKLLKMMAYREGFGDILAEGIVGAAKRIGRGAEKHAVHVKGYSIIEVNDPRIKGLGPLELEEVVHPSRVHAFHGALGTPSYNPGWAVDQHIKEAERVGMPEEAKGRVFDEPTSFRVGRATAHAENWYGLCNCLGLCARLYMGRFYNIRTLTEAYSAITGIQLTPAEMIKGGERAWNMYKMLQVRAGFSRKDDKPPDVWFTPLKGEKGEYPLKDYYKTKIMTREDVEKLLDDFYDERGWDKKTGIPTPEKLKELGLESWISAIPESE